MANKLSHDKRHMILRMLCEGNSIRSTSRVTGCHKNTVAKVILDFGNASQIFLDDVLQDLRLDHIEVDEIWTFVAKKQARLTVDEKAERHDIGDVYVWTCLDQSTKLIATHLVGKRSADNARRLMMDLASRLERPTPHQSDAHAFTEGGYQTVVQISTDGFSGYPEAVDMAFGPYAKYGVLVKDYRNAAMNYTPSEMVGTDRRPISGIREDELGSICTSHVERHNLTIRTFMKRFTRLSLGFSKKLECLEAAVAMFMGYYNFVWRTRHSDKSGKRGTLRPTAAMMAGVVDTLWSFDDFYNEVLMYG